MTMFIEKVRQLKMEMTIFSLGYLNSFNQKEHYILPFKNDFNKIVKKSTSVENSMYISFSIIHFSLKTTTTMNWIFLLNKMTNENSLFSDKQAQKHTEILKKPLLCIRLRMIATTIVHAFTNHSKSKWLEKCERCTFEDEGSKQLTNFTQQHQNLQVMRLSTKKRKQQQKCNLVLPIEKTIDDITVNKTTS